MPGMWCRRAVEHMVSKGAPLTPSSRIFVTGHGGLVGSAIVRQLKKSGCLNLVLTTRAELDLRNQAAVARFFARQRPEFVFLAAAKVGGILANSTRPAEFLYDNLAIQTNVIHAAWQNGAQKLVFLGSSCIYPQLAPQPIKEEYLLTGPLEPTNEAYAIAKIAGLKLAAACREQYGFPAVSLMPTNLYGPGDSFDLEKSHVLPALMRRFHEAKLANAPSVTLWGTGTARREFLHVDDLAAAACFVMEHYEGGELLNALRRGSYHRRTRQEGGADCGLPGRDPLRSFAAGWNAAQAAGCFAHSRARVASAHFVGGGHRCHLRMVLRERGYGVGAIRTVMPFVDATGVRRFTNIFMLKKRGTR